MRKSRPNLPNTIYSILGASFVIPGTKTPYEIVVGMYRIPSVTYTTRTIIVDRESLQSRLSPPAAAAAATTIPNIHPSVYVHQLPSCVALRARVRGAHFQGARQSTYTDGDFVGRGEKGGDVRPRLRSQSKVILLRLKRYNYKWLRNGG